MAVTRHVDLLEPIDFAQHLGKVELYLGQVCQIAGISKMQLDYWTNKAQIPTKGKKQRIYDINALETVMLISNGGTVIKIPVEDVKRLGRATQGVIVMRLRGEEQVSALAPVVESDEAEDEPVDGADVAAAAPEGSTNGTEPEQPDPAA